MTGLGRFAGQVAVITGAGSGIGLAVSRRLRSEGAKVSAWDISASALQAGAETYDQGILMNQADEAAVARAAAQTIGEFGRIDILVVSAGITGPNATLVNYPPAEWRMVMDVNVNGVFYVNRAVVPHMVDRHYGRQGTGAERHLGQRSHSRRCAHADVQPDDAGAHRLHAVEDSRRPIRHRRRKRLADRVAGEPRVLIHHCRGVRYFRRPLHLLIIGASKLGPSHGTRPRCGHAATAHSVDSPDVLL